MKGLLGSLPEEDGHLTEVEVAKSICFVTYVAREVSAVAFGECYLLIPSSAEGAFDFASVLVELQSWVSGG
jgi:hypothetical protein